MTTITPSAFKAVQEACAKVCDKASAWYRERGESGADDATECEEFAYACRQNAREIRSLTPSSIPGLTVAGESGEDDARNAARWNYVLDQLIAGKSVEFSPSTRGIESKILFPVTRHGLNEAIDSKMAALTTAPGKEER